METKPKQQTQVGVKHVGNNKKTSVRHMAKSLETNQKSLSKTDINQLLKEVTAESPLVPNLDFPEAKIGNLSTMGHSTAAFEVKTA
jgi:hypothetical protein